MQRTTILVGGLAVLLMACPVFGTPYFLIDSETQWQDALYAGKIEAMYPSEWLDYMDQWNFHKEEGDPYPDNEFIPAMGPTGDLYVYGGGGGGGGYPEDAGLVMVWQAPDTPISGSYSSAWKWDYQLDPDLSNSTITVTVTAPQWGMNGQINVVSFGIQDVTNAARAWYWKVGQPGDPIQWNIPTTITINTALTGTVATNPQASAYMNNPAFNIVQSQWFIVDENGVWVGGAQPIPPPGGSGISGMWNYWHNLIVSPNIPAKGGDPIKWSQPPEEYYPGYQPPIFYGWDQRSAYIQKPIVADDWLCTDNLPVTDIHWWGSFVNWDQPYPPQLPDAFHIGIWTDVPADPGQPGSFSHPGTLIWDNYCQTYKCNFAGYDHDPRNQTENEACFQFNQYLDEADWFWQDPGTGSEGTIYWLSISAIYNTTPQYLWGWKTRPNFNQDDAVRINAVTPDWPPVRGSDWAGGSKIEYPSGTSWDVAFELTTRREEFEKYAQWPDDTEYGIDIRVDDSDDGIQRTLADDFPCTQSGLITDVHLWCSWTYDEVGVIDNIHLSIHSDDPAGPGGSDPTNSYSKPDLVLWERDFGAGEFSMNLYMDLAYPGEYWWDPAYNQLIPGCDRQIYRIDIYIDPADAFPQEGSPDNPIIYWLDVSMKTSSGEIGWKTRNWPDHYQDDAVWRTGTTTDWNELRYPPGHPYHDMLDNSIDMAFMITTEEEPQRPEACCFSDGSCLDLLPNDCLNQLGTPQGPGTVCSGINEACCLQDGTCMDADPICCDDLGGIPQGPGTACSPTVEACCLQDGSCVDVDPLCCDDLGGVSQGPGSACSANEACCLRDGSCVDADPLCCFNILHGIPQGPGTACTANEACCLQDGSCIDVDPLCCDEMGGVPQGLGSACTANEACCLLDGTCMDADPLCCVNMLNGIPQGPGTACSSAVGACCLQDGTCIMVDPLCCDDMGGITQGAGTTCTVEEACCVNDMTGAPLDCIMVDPLCCDEMGGIPQGAGTQCTVEEACCLRDGTCIMVDPLCCDEMGGVPQGNGTQCTAAEACCLDDGTCMDVDPLCCVNILNGIPQGPGTQCTVAEACCVDDGTGVPASCIMVDPLCCDEMHGNPQGAGTSCSARTIACCLPDGTCQDVDPLCCDDIHGVPSPIGAPACMGDLNSNGIDDACEEEIPKWSQPPHPPLEGFDAASDLWVHQPGGPDIEPVIKYEQWPDLTELGFDVNATVPYILADDFPCTQGGLITDIHIWGSWRGDIFPGYPGNVLFKLSIHADIPAEESPTGYSMPGDPLWEMYFGPGDFAWDMYWQGPEGWLEPPDMWEPGSDRYCFKYDFYIDPSAAFMQEGSPDKPVVYWLDVQAESAEPGVYFGWKTSEIHWNDDAVWSFGELPPMWQELRYPPGHPYFPESVDLAFAITTPKEVNKVVADDFISDGRPIDAVRWWGSYLDERFLPYQGVEPYVIDGWLISFHHERPVADPKCPPDVLNGDNPTVLGLYFAPAGAIEIIPLSYPDCLGHQVFEYKIDLTQCVLICQETDPRTGGGIPAQQNAFFEQEDFRYWLDIQALVGMKFYPGGEYMYTGHLPSPDGDGHFWGWHTSPELCLREACTGQIYNFPTAAQPCPDYGNWTKQPWLCPAPTAGEEVHTAFELLTWLEDTKPPELIAAASVKMHPGVRKFGIDLPLVTPTAGIEDRDFGPTTVVLSFSEAVMACDGSMDPDQEVTTNVDGIPTLGLITQLTVVCNKIIVTLSGVPDQCCLTIAVSAVCDRAGNWISGDNDVDVVVLRSDVSADGMVTAIDFGLIKSEVFKPLTESNFRNDINVDGMITAIDFGYVKADLWHTASCP